MLLDHQDDDRDLSVTASTHGWSPGETLQGRSRRSARA
jgi:hypothetical protein